jgi:hypothetical protein
MYQRWIYRVDPTRNFRQVQGEDGDSGAEEDEGAEAIEEAEGGVGGESKKDK